MSLYSKLSDAKNDGEILEIIVDFLDDNSGRLASVVRQASAEAASAIRMYKQKKKLVKRQRYARTVKEGRTETETTYGEIQWASYHYLAEFTDADGFSELGYLATIGQILIDYIDGSKGRTLEDLEALQFAIMARCRFLQKKSKNMAEGFEHFRNETAGNSDKQN